MFPHITIMETKSNEILDKISSIISAANPWIKCEQPMKKLGYMKFQVQINPDSFSLNDPQFLEQLSNNISADVISRSYEMIPSQYRPAYGVDQLSTIIQYTCSAKLYDRVLLGPSSKLALIDSPVRGSFDQSTYTSICDTKLSIEPIFDKPSHTNNIKFLFFNGEAILNFHDISFKENTLVVSWSIILPQDHLLIELITS